MSRLIVAVLATLCISQAAWASPVDDVTSGTNLYLSQASVSVDGSNPYTTNNVVISKDAGTLNMTLNANSFGLGVDEPVTFQGVASGNFITWSFSQHLSTPYSVGALGSVTDLEGAIVVKADPIPGSEDAECGGAPCAFNVSMSLSAGTWIHVSGIDPTGIITWGRDITVNSARMLGGLPRPVLSGFSVDVPRPRFCTANVLRHLVGNVTIGSPAPSNGAWVNITTSDPANARILGVQIPAGATNQTFRVEVAANYTGAIVLTAASGGAVSTQTINVLPTLACQLAPSVSGPRILYSPQIVGCTSCGKGLDLNDAQAALLSVNGASKLYQATGLLDLTTVVGGSNVSAAHLNNEGTVVGTWTPPSGPSQGFVRNVLDPQATTISLGSLVPLALNDLGVVGGYTSSGSSTSAAYFNGKQTVPVPVPANATSSYVTALNNSGGIVGNYATTKGEGAFYTFMKVVTDLGTLGGSTTVAAVNDSGWSTGSAQTTKGIWSGFIAAPGKQLTNIGVLPGFVNAWPASINSAGVVVGTVDGGSAKTGATHGFIYSSKGGMVDLNSLLDPKLGAQVSQALKITDANEVLVSGQLNGVSGQFVIDLN
jgi:hypothetical protein